MKTFEKPMKTNENRCEKGKTNPVEPATIDEDLDWIPTSPNSMWQKRTLEADLKSIKNARVHRMKMKFN